MKQSLKRTQFLAITALIAASGLSACSQINTSGRRGANPELQGPGVPGSENETALVAASQIAIECSETEATSGTDAESRKIYFRIQNEDQVLISQKDESGMMVERSFSVRPSPLNPMEIVELTTQWQGEDQFEASTLVDQKIHSARRAQDSTSFELKVSIDLASGEGSVTQVKTITYKDEARDPLVTLKEFAKLSECVKTELEVVDQAKAEESAPKEDDVSAEDSAEQSAQQQ